MIKLIVTDVDGTLTDGGVYYDNHGNEIKKFCTKDGMGVCVAHKAGIKVMVLTGREFQATTRRMEELDVDYIFQGVENKEVFLLKWMKENKMDITDTAYVGDDLNDLRPMKLCGYRACPSDAVAQIRELSDYISSVTGGHGVLEDVVLHYLKETDRLEKVLELL
jgi:3-deoxy-D-manno-octulosonate 8-phosphate phosphatase (KDO 8-P phosphatase)